MHIAFHCAFVSWSTGTVSNIGRIIREVAISSLITTVEVQRYYYSTPSDFDLPFFDNSDGIMDDVLTSYGRHHAACVVQTSGSSVNISLYLDGNRVLLFAPLPAAEFWQSFTENTGRPISIYYDTAFRGPGGESHRVAGIRYTERALYTGDTYTPPTSITRLA